MKNKVLTSILFLSLALNLGVACTVGFQWASRRIGGEGPDARHKARFNKMLGLTKEQAATMEQRHQQLKNIIDPLRSRLQDKKREMLVLLKSSDGYTPQMDALIGEIAGLQMEIEKNFTRHSLAVKKDLSPDQQKKFTTMLEKGFMRSHRGPGAPRPR